MSSFYYYFRDLTRTYRQKRPSMEEEHRFNQGFASSSLREDGHSDEFRYVADSSNSDRHLA